MSERDHKISNPSDTQSGGFGKRYPTNYASAYASSPVYKGEITDETIEKTFIPAVQRGEATAPFDAYGVEVPGGVGHKMSSYNRDYVDAPDVAANDMTEDGKVFGSGRGAPTNPYVPPLTSPGPGSVSATDQPAFTGTIVPASGEFGTGLGGLANPALTSPEIATQDVNTATALISGRSYARSAG